MEIIKLKDECIEIITSNQLIDFKKFAFLPQILKKIILKNLIEV